MADENRKKELHTGNESFSLLGRSSTDIRRQMPQVPTGGYASFYGDAARKSEQERDSVKRAHSAGSE